jgi:hypothetical protein
MNPNNVLAIKFPELIKEWHSTKNRSSTPYDVTYGTNKKVWWKCKLGHEWKSSVAKRTIGKRKCPFCLRDGCSVADKEFLKEWNYKKNQGVDPSCISCHSDKRFWWKCKHGHEWLATPRKRSKGRGCHYCSGWLTPLNKSLFYLRKDLMKLWNYGKNKVSPKLISVFSGKKVWWKCSKNHEWTAVVASVSTGIGCPVCSGRNATDADNIVIKRPDLMKEWDYNKNKGIDPYGFKQSSGRVVGWKCSKGHRWKASLHTRSAGCGCPSCKKYEVYDGEICDSLIECFYYLKFKRSKTLFVHNKRYDFKRRYRFDFYLPKDNKYIEVTSFDNKLMNFGYLQYRQYLKRIREKEKLVKQLGAKFEFIQRSLTREELRFVQKYAVKT